jgi:hypothetical protein
MDSSMAMGCWVLGLCRRNLARASLVQRRERDVWLERRADVISLADKCRWSVHSHPPFCALFGTTRVAGELPLVYDWIPPVVP